MLQMVLMSARQDCYVIKANKDKLVLLSHKSYVHGPLKSSPNIHESKIHIGLHESARRSSEGSLFLIFWVYTNLIVT